MVLLIIFLSVIILIGLLVQLYLFKRKRKFDGSMVVKHRNGKKFFSLELDKDPDELSSMKFIVFKVINEELEEG